MPEMQFTTDVNRPVADVFDLLADLPNYSRWLPPSDLFAELPKISDNPIKLGTTYIDQGQSTPLYGKITEFNPPTRLTFYQVSKFPVPGFLANLTIQIRYSLEAENGGTKLTRDIQVNIGGLLKLLQSRLLSTIRHENERILAMMKAYLEAEVG